MLEFAPRSKDRMSYSDAILYCQFLTHNGHIDWRMPTYNEYSRYQNIASFSWFWDQTIEGSYYDDVRYVYPVRDVC